MVAINTTTKNNIYLAREHSPEVEKIVLTKQQKRIKEQYVRKAKKRQAKAVQQQRQLKSNKRKEPLYLSRPIPKKKRYMKK